MLKLRHQGSQAGLMKSHRGSRSPSPSLVAQWPLPTSATLGSAVRAKGIDQEIRARLPVGSREGDASRLRPGTSSCVRRKQRRMTSEPPLRPSPRTLEGIEVLPCFRGRRRTSSRSLPASVTSGSRIVACIASGRAREVAPARRGSDLPRFRPPTIEDILDRDLPAI